MSNNKPIQFILFGAMLTKMELFWSLTYFLMFFPISLASSPENSRHWKDHLKNDSRSDQDHRLKLDRRSDQDHPLNFFILDQDHIIYHFLPSKSPFFEFSYKTFLTNYTVIT
jgi:hypothetical protein